jgi:uncharacterized membrane protein
MANIGRFHAWQSSLVFSASFVLHLLFSWSRFLSWLLFIGDLGLIVLLVFRAYRDGEFVLFFKISSHVPHFYIY